MHAFDDEKTNPFKKEIPEDEVPQADCLVPFVIWQESSVSVLPGELSIFEEEMSRVQNEMRDTFLDTNSEKECQLEDGIFTNEICHYYEVLDRICIKINLKGSSVQYQDGCYAGREAASFKKAKVGSYYDFQESVSFEIRANQDPYMVFAYTRDNLGTDSRIFMYLSIFSLCVGLVLVMIILKYYCFKLEKK